jgi:Tfp pilus assembly protein PilF
VRQKARRISEKLRQDVESVQFVQPAGSSKGSRQAPVWAIFEQAIQRYKAEEWAEACKLFQDCVQKDPNWSAAYQYLALVYHALGQENEAAWAAEQALEKDPDNARLSAWANTLRATLNQKRPPAA